MGLIVIEDTELEALIGRVFQRELDKSFERQIKKHLLPEDISTKEAVKQFGYSESTLKNYRKSGKLGKWKVGGKNIYKRSELDKLPKRVKE